MNRTRSTRHHLGHLALALALGVGMGAERAPAQTILEVAGAGVIGDESLPTNSVPAVGANWTADGGEGIVQSYLTSPTVAVGTSGEVTLTFDHRYSFETGWDGGAVFVSVNGAAFTYVDTAAFTANPYVGDTTAAGSNAWPGGEEVFYASSDGYETPALITSVASLGTLNAGDTVAVQFRGWWDDATLDPAPNWEIGTVRIADPGAALLDADFASDGPAGFTVTDVGSVAGPWVYLKPVSTFEIDADTLTADRYAPSVPGAVIDLNDAALAVKVLAGSPEIGDTFTLFDLSGTTTLTGTYSSLSLPPGTWDVSKLTTEGTITMTALPRNTGFTLLLRDVTGGSDGQVNTTSEAESIIALTAPDASYDYTDTEVTREVIDVAGGNGNFGVNDPLPDGTTGTTKEDYILRASAYVRIPAGTWSIGFGSDDGGMLKVDGITFLSKTNDSGSADNEVRWENPRGHTWTWGTFTTTSQLDTTINALMYERGGGDSFEIALYPGEGVLPTSGWELLADGVQGWLVQWTPIDDTTPPSIVTLDPAGGSSGANPGGNLVATFDEEIALTGMGTITLTDLTNGSDNRTITLPNAGVTVSGPELTIDPGADLEFGTNYEVSIDGDAIEDLFAQPNAYPGTAAGEWTFTTTPPDTTAPVIVSLDPLTGATGVPPNTALTATFDEGVLLASAADPSSSITLKNLDDGVDTVIPANDSTQLAVDGAVLTITPAVFLTGGKTYAVQIGPNAVRNFSGIPFAGISDDTTWRFSTLSGTTMTVSSNWLGGTWSFGEPVAGLDAIIAAGVTATANNSVNPWSGTLTLEENAVVSIQSSTNPNPPNMAFEGATRFILKDGSRIIDNFKTATFPQDFVITGTAGMDCTNNSGNNHNRIFTGTISGGTWVTDGRNHQGYTYNSANTFASYEVGSADSQRHGVAFNAPGAAGLGDVTVTTGTGTQSAVLILGADNVFSDTCVLTLNGRGWDGSGGGFGPYAAGPWVSNSARIALQGFNATVKALYIDDVQQEAGEYTGGDGDWIVGAGTLTVLTGPSSDYSDWAAALYPGADLADPDADLDGDGLTNDEERLFGLDPTDPASLDPYVVPFNAADGTFSFTRRDDALTGRFSGIETSTDLLVWTKDGGADLTPGDPDANAIETVAVMLSEGLRTAPTLFVRVVQDDGVFFSANFEDDDGGFTATGAPNDWAWGEPKSDNNFDLAVNTGNGGSARSWGTALGDGSAASGFITKNVNSILRSPDIDLSAASGARLQFAAAVDATGDDIIEVLVKEAGSNRVLETIDAITVPLTAEWANFGPFEIPGAAGKNVYLEFRFQGVSDSYLGLYIDDVTVSRVP